MRNVPPPYLAARYGKRHMLPNPTAEAAAAKMNAHLPDHEERAGAPVDAIVFLPLKSQRSHYNGNSALFVNVLPPKRAASRYHGTSQP